MVHDVDIRLATFGTGLHVADVTDRVIGLLRENEAGFSPTGHTLGVDPLPYTPKALVIDYYYQGEPYRFAVVGQQHVSYEMLVENAEQ